jgi:non-ribosomal peptide synthetase component F
VAIAAGLTPAFARGRVLFAFHFYRVACNLSLVRPPRPWTAHYHPETATDLPALVHPHLPALVRESAAAFAAQEAFSLALPNGTQGGISFAEVDALSDAFAVYLREVAGFAAGDRLSIQMPNCLAYPVVVFGALKAGLVMVNTNPLYTPPEMAHQFTDSGSVGLVDHRPVRRQGGAGAAQDRHPHGGGRVAWAICCRRSSAGSSGASRST